MSEVLLLDAQARFPWWQHLGSTVEGREEWERWSLRATAWERAQAEIYLKWYLAQQEKPHA